jgi:hypothetical protein
MEAYVRVKKDRSDEEIKENEVCDCLSSRGRTLIESPGTAQQGVTPTPARKRPGCLHRRTQAVSTWHQALSVSDVLK